MIKTLTFNLVMNEGEIDVDTLNKLALCSQRIERASKSTTDREEQIRKQTLEQAADTVEEAAIQNGMNEEQAQWMRAKLLGIKR